MDGFVVVASVPVILLVVAMLVVMMPLDANWSPTIPNVPLFVQGI